MKKIVIVTFILVALLTSCSEKENELYIYNWGDYIDESIIESFEEETGIKVVYEMFDTNEGMYAKIKNGGTAYDIVIPSDYMVERMIKEDMLQKLDLSKIPNFKNISEEFKGLYYDKNNEYSVPYFFGTNGLLYNSNIVKEDVDSWSILWDEKYKNEILMNNSYRDSIMIGLKLLGYSMNSVDEKELNEARDLLIEQRDLVLAYVIDNGKDIILKDEAAFLVTWNGDAVAMIDEKPELKYVIPKEGSNLWTDAMVIPKASRNSENAHKFIDYILRADIGLINTRYVGYSTPNAETFKLLTDEERDDEVAYPDISNLKNMEEFKYLGDKIKLYNDLWLQITTN